jgi:HSP20 family protein
MNRLFGTFFDAGNGEVVALRRWVPSMDLVEEGDQERKEGYYRLERAAGRFSRSLTLPERVDPQGIDTKFEGGVLTVSIPKPQERKSRRVAINVGEKVPVIEGSEPSSQ